MKALPDAIDRWLPRPLVVARHRRLRPQREPRRAARPLRGRRRFVVVATLAALARDGQVDAKVVQQAIKDLEIDPEKTNPAIA